MEHDPFKWGRPRNDVYGPYSYEIAGAKVKGEPSASDIEKFPSMHTQRPIITGTSVLAVKFNGGVIMAADNVGAYGSLLRFSNIERIIKVGDETVVGISGDISDMQYIERLLEELETEEDIYDSDGGHKLRAPHVHEYLSQVMYNRRSKMNPLWNAIVVAGFDDTKEPFLRYVDLLGVAYGSSAIATGFGSYLAVPLLRNLVPYDADYPKVSEEEARETIVNCMKVLYYRDARSLEKFSLVTLRKDQPLAFEKNVKCEGQSWQFAKNICGYGSKQL